MYVAAKLHDEMETKSLKCPNCGAPVEVDLGDIEVPCEYCGSELRIIPEAEELEVIRTREEMKYRERVAVQKAVLRKKLEQEEMDRWRQTAAKVAISAMPVVGEAAGKAMFRGAVRRSGGCLGCGCIGLIAGVAALLLGLL
jgi:DNA-directed RNA polymerase subunit RPC12/RpoP